MTTKINGAKIKINNIAKIYVLISSIFSFIIPFLFTELNDKLSEFKTIPDYSNKIQNDTNVIKNTVSTYKNNETNTYVICHLAGTNNSSAKVYINEQIVGECSFSTNSGASVITVPIFLPKGDIIKIAASSTNASKYTVYGVK